MNLKIDPGLEKAIGDMAVKTMTARFQLILDSIYDEYAGQRVDLIKPVLAQRWAGSDGASITDPEWTKVAQAISDKKRVRMVEGRPTSGTQTTRSRATVVTNREQGRYESWA